MRTNNGISTRKVVVELTKLDYTVMNYLDGLSRTNVTYEGLYRFSIYVYYFEVETITEFIDKNELGIRVCYTE